MTTNFVQTCKTSANRINLNRTAMRVALIGLFISLGIGNAWAHSKHYGKATLVNATGNGTVYLSTASGSNSGQSGSSNPGTKDGTSWITWNCGENESNDSKTYYARGTANNGYYYAGYATSSSATTYTAAATGKSFTATSKTDGSPNETKIYGFFKPVTIPSVATPSPNHFDATNTATTCLDYTGTVVFTTANADAKEDFQTPTITNKSGNGNYTVTSYTYESNKVTVSYKFTGDGTYGGTNRSNSATITLTSAGGENSRTSTAITANFPNAKVNSGSCDEIPASFKASDASQADKAWTATFDVEYVDGENNFDTPTFTGADASHFTYNSMTISGNVVTVNFTYNGNKEATTHTATLTLKVKDAIGGTDATYGSKGITVTAVNEEEPDYDVEVRNAGGTLISNNTTTWAQGLSLANNNAGSTIKLMRDINLGTITATNNITKATTIDLNGKELRAAVNATSVGVLTITAAVPVTIKDSKTGGKIINEIARNSEIRTIFVNKAGATLTLESGTIAVNNLGQYASAANANLGVVAYASCAARAIHQIAGTTVNINGGRVEAYGTRSVFGIVQASSVATNKAGTTVLNITGGEIYAEAPYAAYGLQGYGKVNFSGGNINVKANTNMIDARYAADNANNKYNGLIYGILISAYANATATSCYYGTLNMTGGNINVTNERVGGYDRKSYGVLIDCANANMGANTAVDGSKCQKAAAKGSIDGGTITVNSGTYYSFGVYMSGSYNSYDNTSHVLTVKNCTIDVKAHTYAYGVFSQGAVNTTNGGCYHGDIELTNCTVTAETTVGAYSYAAFVTSRVATIYKNASTAAANYYHGEYGSAGKLTINSGTYKAYSKTTTAYCVSAGNEWVGEARARTVYADETNVALTQHLGGNVEAYPTLIIHGGDFYAETFGTTTARAVSSGGHTTIDGGTFKAVAKTNNAYGLVAVSGTMKATGITVEAEGNATVYGVLVNAGISDYTLFDYAADVELNNCDVTATTRTGTEARGVSVVATTKTQTEATKETLKTNGTKEGATSTQKNNYNNYYNIYHIGEKAVAAKVKINGGTYRATAATTTAYGVVVSTTSVSATGAAHASAEGTIKNATFVVKTNGTTSATGIYAGGPTTIEGCNITVQPKTTTGYGVYINDKKTTLSNTTINVTTANTADATKSAAAYGIYNNASISSIGWIFEGELEANEGNVVDVKTTSGTTAYGVYTHAVNKAITSEVYTTAGTYVAAARTTINGGKYTAHANNTTGYAVVVADPVLGTEVTGIPTCIINGGKFKGTATSTYADVSVAGEPGYFVLNGGYYVKDENLDKKLGEGMNKVAVKSGTPEYTEGYRWRVTDNMTGEYVCKIKENSTSYASLEEALQVVNATPNSTWTIIMIANYTLSKGDYVLPAKTTLLIPYQSSQTTINGASPKWVTEKGTVAPAYKLTFANGVNMTVFGKIEASSTTYIVSSTATGIVGGPYGWLYLNEGSHIDLESGAFIYAWGYITGDGTINAKNGSTMYEDFQMGDWRGGAIAYAMNDNTNGLNGKGVFLLNDYFFQNIESEITYRPGATAIALSGTQLSSSPYYTDPVNMVGTSDALFLMDPATAGADTWVKKKYNADTDRLEWTLNSGASVGNMRIAMDLGFYNVDMDSKNFVLPITGNFTIIANEGTINLNNDMCILPGCEIIVKKEAILNIPSGKYIYVYDQDDRSKYVRYYYTSVYSPSWKVNPRAVGTDANTKLPDAKILVEGLIDVKGRLYTTAAGANIYSTRENAGKILFETAPPASISAPSSTTTSKSGIKTTLVQVIASSGSGFSGQCTYEGKALNPAWLKNEDGTYSKPTSANTSAGDTWVYMQSLTSDTYEWVLASEDGCFTTRKTGDTKTYVHPSDWVAVGDINANHAYPSEDGTRMVVNAEAATSSKSCVWWEVNPTPEVIDGVTYYVANNENFDNFGTYYYWDNTTSYWKPKKITVTWQNEDGTKITNGTYGDLYSFNTSPQFFGTNPKKTPTDIEKYDWIGWRDAEGNIYDKNATLPRATSNVTYTAYFNTTKYQYTITFKNDDNSDLWAGLVDAGTTGAELQALFETKYNEKTGSTIPLKASSVDKVYTFSSWNTSLATVTAAATYTANYTWVTRKYHVTFYSYDAATVLYETDVDYNTTRPVYGGVTPFRSNTSAYSYEWTGWQQGATHYGTTDNLALVTGDVYYVATFSQTTLKYQVLFKRQDGTIIDAPFFTYDETPSAFPANPTMASSVSTDYTFREWSPATLVPVTEDGKVYTALFDESVRQYTAHFVNYDGASLNVDQTIDYNTVPTYTGTTPIKPNDSRNSYVFSGWAWTAGDGWEAGSIAVGEAFPAIKGDITFTAQYTPTLLQFDVIYQREDGFVILRDKKKWGESSAFPTTYTGATSGLDYEDESYSYTFDHWSPATVVDPVTANATYTAYYNQSIKTYSITAVGISPAGYGSVSPASLSGIPGGSTVTVDGNKITVNGTTITATPTAATAQYTYAFDHWNNVPATVTGNVANIEAVFTRTVNQYTVLWKSEDGTSTIETDDNQNYGAATAFNGTAPTKDATAQYTYTFDGWATEANGAKVYEIGATPTVSGAATYYAHFAATLRKYTVSVAATPAGYGTVSAASVAEVPYGTAVTKNGNKITVNGTTITATPAAATAQYTYAFSQWDNVPATVTGNVSIEAVFTRTVNQYTVLWKSEDGTSTIETDDNQNYGAATAFNGTAPTKDATAQYTYTFDGWATEANGAKVYEIGATPTVSGAATYYAHFAQTTNAYTVTWKNADGTELEKDEDVSYGTTPEYNGETPTQTATATDVYTFAGWDSEIAAVTGDATYTATYTSDPPVASVTVSGETTYYATLQEAFDYAADKATPTITVLKNVTEIATKLTYTNTSKTTVTFDLNGHTVAGKVNQLLYLTSGSNTGGTIVIKSSVEGGQIRNVLSSTSSQYCVYLVKGKLTLESGTIYNENTSTGASYAINVASGRTFTMTDGKLEAKGKTSVYTLYSVGTSNVSGGTIKATETTSGTSAGVCVMNGKTTISGDADIQVNGTANAYGARVGYRPNSTSGAAYNGTLEITGGKFTVEASGASAIGVYSYAGTRAIASKGNFVSAGTANISGGQFDVTAATKAYGVYVTGTVSIATAKDADGNAYPEASAASKATITNGKFKVESTGDDNATAYAMNSEATETSLLVQGGWYNTEKTNASSKPTIGGKYTAPTKDCNYHVLPLTDEDPYKYEVAEAYTITFKNGDDVLQSTAVKKGATPAYSGATPTKTADAQYTYTFTGWSPALAIVTEAATYTATFTQTVNKYTITWVDGNGVTLKTEDLEYGAIPSYTGTTPTKAEDENYTYTFNGTWSPAITSVTDDATYTAQFNATSKETGFWADIVDVDNSANTLTLNVTGWASSGWPYTINGVEYKKTARETDRTLIIPYTGEAGGNFTITVVNNSSTTVSKHNYIIPTAITSNTILGNQQVIFVKPDIKLTVDADKTIKNIYVAPGAKLVVNSGKTLTADTVFLRTTPWASAELELNGTITGQVCYTRIICKKDAYYQFGLPMPCNIADVRLSDGTKPVYGNGWLLRSYSESNRAQNGTGTDIDNWVTLTSTGADDAEIQGRTGYEMFSNSGYYREYYFPVAHTGQATSVAVTRTTENTKGAAHEGWNIVCSPLMSTYTIDPAPEGLVFSWLREGGDYEQLSVTEVKPAIPFSYQAKASGSITFDNDVTVPSAIAARRVPTTEEKERIQWIHLDITAANGVGDQTSIYSHPTRYEQTYKTGIDVAKQSLTASRAILYSTHAYGDMAFAGVSDSKLTNGIPLVVYSPKAQELTISMRENAWLNRLTAVWLIDHETGIRTDLLWSTYTFDAAEGTAKGRFTLMGEFKAPQVTTGLENGQSDQEPSTKARKVIIEDKIYIQLNGHMYDSTGKKVN